MKDWIFGYGSLVNERTRRTKKQRLYVELDGWRRNWGHRVVAQGIEISSLTISPSDQDSIQGVITAETVCTLAEIDKRETHYKREEVEDDVILLSKAPARLSLNNKIYIYVSKNLDPDERFHERRPILQSYLDCILDGYYRHFGPEGAARFIATTDGWERPIKNDRSNPLYPRALQYSQKTIKLFDELVQKYTVS